MSAARDLLIEARGAIASEDRWWPGAKRAPSATISMNYNCAETALCYACIHVGFSGFKEARAALFARTGNIAHFNDTHAHAEVLAAFDRAIEGSGPAEHDEKASP